MQVDSFMAVECHLDFEVVVKCATVWCKLSDWSGIQQIKLEKEENIKHSKEVVEVLV